MTLTQFEKQLQKFVPGLRLRIGGYGDVVGVYVYDKYIVRLSKGDLHLYTHREKAQKSNYQKFLEAKGGQVFIGPKKRGRMEALNILVNMRWLTSTQAQQIMWGYV